jgi:hypothetical protein
VLSFANPPESCRSAFRKLKKFDQGCALEATNLRKPRDMHTYQPAMTVSDIVLRSVSNDFHSKLRLFAYPEVQACSLHVRQIVFFLI